MSQQISRPQRGGWEEATSLVLSGAPVLLRTAGDMRQRRAYGIGGETMCMKASLSTTATASLAIFWLFFAAFNLLTLFLYRQLRCYGRDRGKNVTRTISRLIGEMNDDLARLVHSPLNSS
jgi:hypothetical protein